MSTASGNMKKSGPPKHQNKTAFKNNLHDTSQRTKQINAIEVVGACSRCTEILQWKIKYKKYKPLTVPKKCTICSQKSVARAYYIVCDACHKKTGKCGRCGKVEEIVKAPGLSPAEEARQQADFEKDMKMLTERQRRTFFRLQAKGSLRPDASPLEVVSCDQSNDEDDDINGELSDPDT